MRNKCPVAKTDGNRWWIFRHRDIKEILHNHTLFSNEVSEHISVPNGMDPPEHTKFRRIIVQYFEEERIKKFKPVCRKIAGNLLENFRNEKEIESIDQFARTFAVQVQCSFMGWSRDMHQPLREWTLQNIEAIRNNDRDAMKQVAATFQTRMLDLLDKRRKRETNPEKDLTAHLMHQSVDGQLLKNEEIISILRNWTMGEVGTITNAVGILAHFTATHQDIQTKLRSGEIPLKDAVEEILRLHGPLVTNRRKATSSVEIGGKTINEGDQLILNWVSANRDEEVFPDAHTFNPGRSQDENLLYGAGIHQCPAAPLARMELCVVLEELLGRTSQITISPDKVPVIAKYPASGYDQLYLRIK